MSFRVLFNSRCNGPSEVSKFSNKVYQFSGARFYEGQVVTFPEEMRAAMEHFIASDTIGIKRGKPIARILDEKEEVVLAVAEKDEPVHLSDVVLPGAKEDDFIEKVVEAQDKPAPKRRSAKSLRAEILGHK